MSTQTARDELATAIEGIHKEIAECKTTIAGLEKIKNVYETDGAYDHALACLAEHLRELRGQRKWLEGRYVHAEARLAETATASPPIVEHSSV